MYYLIIGIFQEFNFIILVIDEVFIGVINYVLFVFVVDQFCIVQYRFNKGVSWFDYYLFQCVYVVLFIIIVSEVCILLK